MLHQCTRTFLLNGRAFSAQWSAAWTTNSSQRRLYSDGPSRPKDKATKRTTVLPGTSSESKSSEPKTHTLLHVLALSRFHPRPLVCCQAALPRLWPAGLGALGTSHKLAACLARALASSTCTQSKQPRRVLRLHIVGCKIFISSNLPSLATVRAAAAAICLYSRA